MNDPLVPTVPPNWWQNIFDEVYLETDARSVLDAELTCREVDGLLKALNLKPEETILDLCGGHGRHALELARRGFAGLLVLDFSQPLLSLGQAQARQEGLAVTFLRGDARQIPLAGGSFRVVLCLANSFGYGATPEDDLQVLRESCRLLKPGGRLFLEVADPEYLRRHLPPLSWHETAAQLVVCRRRWLLKEYLVCRELVLCRTRGLVRDRAYQVRLYNPEDLRNCLIQAGFSRVTVAAQPDLYAQAGDHGALNRRLAATAWK